MFSGFSFMDSRRNKDFWEYFILHFVDEYTIPMLLLNWSGKIPGFIINKKN